MINLKLNFAKIMAAGCALALCLVGPRAVVASPLEIEIAVRIPGPSLVIQRPLNLSIDERLSAQQIEWDLRLTSQLRALDGSKKNSDSTSLKSNPLPTLSAFLSDAYQAVSS
jgi:hypothetical protein